MKNIQKTKTPSGSGATDQGAFSKKLGGKFNA